MASETLFAALHYPATALYSLSVLYFAIVLSLKGDVPTRRNRAHKFLSWGPVLGLSMGALIAGGLGLHYLAMDGFHWSTQDGEQQRTLIKHGVFLVLWVSHFHLEIWTQEPLRKLGNETQDELSPAWSKAHRQVRRQLVFNSALIVCLGGLSIWP